jgi:hypothetical protein
VIRRGFWLVVGATLGVTGYRRASRLLQSFRPPSSSPAGPVVLRSESLLTGRRVLAGAARAGRGAAASAAFVRDVRDGVAEYLDQQDQQDQQDSATGRTLGSQQDRASRGRSAS